MSYKQEKVYRTRVKLLKGIHDETDGIVTKSYEETEVVFNCSAKSYNGTEKVVNDLVVIEDTCMIETYYRPDITTKDAIMFIEDGAIYEIISPPQDINHEHKILLFKVRRYFGGV